MTHYLRWKEKSLLLKDLSRLDSSDKHRNDGSLASVPKVKLAGSWRRFRAQADFCVVEGRLLCAVNSAIEAVVAAARKRP